MDDKEILDTWNSQLSNHLIANNVILVIYMVVGVFGNVLVIFIYNLKLSKRKDDRYFIPVLATMDLIACLIGSSYALALNILPAKFTNDILCKVLWYFSEVTTISSALLLVVVAVQRYLKVCKPLATFNLQWKRIAIFLCFITASTFSVPTLFFYGKLTFPHPVYNITGSRCGQLERNDRPFRNAVISYTILEFLFAIIGCISFTVMYALIGKQIYKKFIIFKRTMTLRRRPIGKNAPKGSISDDAKIRSSVDSVDIDVDITVSSITDSRDGIMNDKYHPKRKKRHSLDMLQENVSALKQHFHTHRYTYMFMAITIFFAISFIPRIILMVLESVNRNFWRNLVDQPRTIALCLFFYRFYIFNHIINPFIYGFFDSTFKHEVKKLFCKQTDVSGSETEF